MKAVATAVVVGVLLPLGLIGCAGVEVLQTSSPDAPLSASERYERDWQECRRYALIDGLMAPAPSSAPAAPAEPAMRASGPAGVAPAAPPPPDGAAQAELTAQALTERCMKQRGHAAESASGAHSAAASPGRPIKRSPPSNSHCSQSQASSSAASAAAA